MTPRGRLLVRPAAPSDVRAIARLLDACTRIHLDRETTEAEAEARLREPGSDPSLDSALVLRDDGDLVGFGHVWNANVEIRCFARVHPDAIGSGVGTALYDRLEPRAAALAHGGGLADEALLTATSWAADTAAPALFRGRSFRELRHFLRMTIDLGRGETRPADPPDGVTLREFRPGEDDDALLAAWRDAFAGHWGVDTVDAERWWHDRRDAPGSAYDPSLWTVAEAAGEIVGFSLGVERDDGGTRSGYVSDVGVSPAWRGRGLAASLLTRSFQTFQARGAARATLDVDAENLSGALRLYRKVGMRPDPLFTIWGKEIGRLRAA
jgi:mycothiol synthase